MSRNRPRHWFYLNRSGNDAQKKIFPYSAIKINVNKPERYLLLKPDTDSDSPSEKSNGVRLVSAIQEITHSREMSGITKRRESNLENLVISSIS